MRHLQDLMLRLDDSDAGVCVPVDVSGETKRRGALSCGHEAKAFQVEAPNRTHHG